MQAFIEGTRYLVQVNTNAVSSGRRVAENRFAAFFPDAPLRGASLVEPLITAALAEEAEQWTPLGISLFTEVVTLGALSRDHFERGQLNLDEVRAFLPYIRRIFDGLFDR